MTDQQLKETIAAAERNPEDIARAVTGLPAKILQYKPAPNKWSIQEILAHLADSELVFAYRLRQALADMQPTFAPIDQDAWARELGYLEASAPELVAQYALLRRSNVRLLRRAQPADFEKSGFHPEQKRQITVAELAGYMSKHGPNHLEQIERLKQQPA
jgi:uncharacterized damage-inducible protein DinB